MIAHGSFVKARGPALCISALLLWLFAGARAAIAGTAAPSNWQDYQIIIWQSETSAAYDALKSIGISGAALVPDRDDPRRIPPEALALNRSGLQLYLENIATDFYSAYHRWFPDHPVNWRFVEVQKRFLKGDNDPGLLQRDPSLVDPHWIGKIEDRLQRTVRAYRADHPLFYNLADEAGIADLTAYWDFDFSRSSLAGFRSWLAARYGGLDALNAQWGSNFASWDAVVPETTSQAMVRTDDDYSAWADFKAWMDASFAHALAEGARAVHAVDPAALAGLEGAQVPGWGGYDYSRLAASVDVMEIGEDELALVHSLNPRLVLVTTAFGSGESQRDAAWRALLDGARGLILWDGKHPSVDPQGQLTARGQDLAPLFLALRGGLGAQLVNSHAEFDPVAILYSQASMRTQWMLDWRSKGDTWSHRDADAENEPNDWRTALYSSARVVADEGMQPRYITSEMIEHGVLDGGAIKLLILPHALALSRREVSAIRDFAAQGGTVIADAVPGQFDEHSRRRTTPPLDAVIPRDDLVTGFYGNSIAHALAQAHLRPAIRLVSDAGTPVAGIDVHRYSNGRVTIVALQRLSESQASPPKSASLALPSKSFVYDIRAKKPLGYVQQVPVVIDGSAPTLLALSPTRLGPPTVVGPKRLRLGESGTFRITVPQGASSEVLHVDVADPAGRKLQSSSSNVFAHEGVASFRLSPGIYDEAGTWKLQITDLLSGADVAKEVSVVRR